MADWKAKLKGLCNSLTEKDAGPAIDKFYLQNIRLGSKGECDLVIGLDFGTSSTKVVIQAPDLPGKPSYAVKFGKVTSEKTPYFLPTKLWVREDGSCSLKKFDGATEISDIKLELLPKANDLKSSRGADRQRLSPQEVAVCYLALTLWVSRRWFFEKKSDLIKQFSKIVWNVNLGVPSPCIEDNEENIVFRKVGEVAWKLSTKGLDGINLRAAKDALHEYDEYGHSIVEEECDFDIIPEIAAGAIGYALSNLRQEGLHVMIDVGSSTVDACTFNLNQKSGTDRYSLLISDVKPYGVYNLYKRYLLEMQNIYRDHIGQVRDIYEPMAPLNDSIEQLVINEVSQKNVISSAKEQFKKELLYILRVVIWQTRCRRDPDSSVWSKNGRLPVLLIGGGNRLGFFHSSIEELNDWLIDNANNEGINYMFPPIPDSLADSVSDNDQYNLLAVAWGLSHRSLDIGDIIPADQIKDVEPPPLRDYSHKYVGKELT